MDAEISIDMWGKFPFNIVNKGLMTASNLFLILILKLKASTASNLLLSIVLIEKTLINGKFMIYVYEEKNSFLKYKL